MPAPSTIQTSDLGAAFGAVPQAENRHRLPRYHQQPTVAFALFLAFVFARYIQLGARRGYLGALRIEFVLGAVVLVAVLWLAAKRAPEIGRSRNLLILISALFFAMVIQLPLAAAPVIAKSFFIDRVIKFAMLTLFMVVMIESPRHLMWFVSVYLLAVFYITLESVQGLINGSLVWENQGVRRLHGAVEIYAHPNSLGGVAMGSLPFFGFYIFQYRNLFIRLGLLAVATTSVICVIYSGSRTAYIGLLTLVLWFWIQAERKIRFLVAALVVGSVAVTIIPPEYIQRFESIKGRDSTMSSKEMRIQILEDAFQVFQEHPLGVGIASFPAVRMARFGRSQDTHNLYLEVATNLGIQGFVVFMILVGVMMAEFHHAARAFREQRRRLRRLARQGPLPAGLRRYLSRHDGDLRILDATAKAGGGFILVRLALGFFGMDLYEVYWWFGAGLAIVLSGMVVRTRRITAKMESLVAAMGAGKAV